LETICPADEKRKKRKLKDTGLKREENSKDTNQDNHQ